MTLLNFLFKKQIKEFQEKILKFENDLNTEKSLHHSLKNENNSLKDELIEKEKSIQNLANALNQAESKLTNYSPLLDIENEIFQKKQEYQELQSIYKDKLTIYNSLDKQLNLYTSELNPIEYGVYNPIFNYSHSEDYKRAILLNNKKQKNLYKENRAVTSNADEIYYNHKFNFLTSSYKKSINNYKKIISIAFNSECDSIIAKVKWNNISLYEERIVDIFHRININSRDFCSFILLQNYIVNNHQYNDKDFNVTYANHMIEISNELLELKVEELKLNYEYQLKKQEEKEEERRIRELIREEEKAQRDFEKALKETKLKEFKLRKLLEENQKKLLENQENQILKNKIKELEFELLKVIQENTRALSMAQQTKCGFVYIISNIGSFGTNIFKIGMTRRLEPRDRIRELSNASVPFQFDVHTLMYSENAPELENKLHKIFDNYKINLMNNRKEFFKIPIELLENTLKDLKIDCTFIREVEAKQFRETQQIIEEMTNKSKLITTSKNHFPSDI